jgi:signal transduction histidine kinase
VKEAVEEIRPSTERHDVRVEAGQEEIVGTWDRQRLSRIMINLLANAVKYSPGGGTITVRLDVEEERGVRMAVTRVSDSGIGIPEGELSRIFDRFYRASNVASRIDGTGIGLTGARYIAQRHGGDLSVESVLGAGATFTVKLPLRGDG